MDPQYPAYGYYEDEFGYDNNNPGHMAQGTTGGFYEGVNGYGDFEYGQDTQGISGVPVAPVQGGNAIYTIVVDGAETPGAADPAETLETAETEDDSSTGSPDSSAPGAFIPAEQQQQQQVNLPPIGTIQAFVSDRPFLGLGPPEFIEVGLFTGYWDPTRNLMTLVPVPGQRPMPQPPIQHHFAGGPVNHAGASYPSTAYQAPPPPATTYPVQSSQPLPPYPTTPPQQQGSSYPPLTPHAANPHANTPAAAAAPYYAYPPPPPPQQQQHQQFAAPGFAAPPPRTPTPYYHQQQGYPPPAAPTPAPYPDLLALVNEVVAGRGPAAGEGGRVGGNAAGDEAEMDEGEDEGEDKGEDEGEDEGGDEGGDAAGEETAMDAGGPAGGDTGENAGGYPRGKRGVIGVF
ncbi:MAG: hypothetical protein LQ350_000528 [Teloschistes chrysophthalmus]|nr:MAG: hypothetical protein LQ350_000528 [Niorma chrysophthalma]